MRIFNIILIYSLGLLTFSGCKEDLNSNSLPTLEIKASVNNLQATVTGIASDSDGQVSKLAIDWGDSSNELFSSGNLNTFSKLHTYSDSTNYTITVTVTDNNNQSSSEIVEIFTTKKNIILANVKDGLFKKEESEYLILTINLHTYQENNQQEKLELLADFIHEMNIDFVAFQECAQNKSSSMVTGNIRTDNMAFIVTNLLKSKYNLDYNYVWDWSHYGWNVWEEGIAILSTHPRIDSESKYISSITSKYDIKSRKVIYGSYQTDDGLINILSTHTHWRTSTTDAEQNNQINQIKQMATEKEQLNTVVGSFVCGDFNVNPTSDYPWSEGYNTMINNGEYIDTFFEIYPDANNKPAQSKYNTIGGTYPGRIDYIFMKNYATFKTVESQIIFTPSVVGVISDHYGVITKVKKTL